MLITAIEPQKKRKGRFSVFVDGAFAFGMDEGGLSRYGLKTGADISRERLDYLLNEAVFAKARDTALRFIGARARSRRETERRLEQDLYPEEIIDRVIRLMVKYKYVDDARFALDYAESRLKNGRYGMERVRRELKMKGVAAEHIERAAELAGGHYNGADAVAEYLNLKNPDLSDRRVRDKTAAALHRRGFTYSIIKEAFELYRGQRD